jgi:hypothetical protein
MIEVSKNLFIGSHEDYEAMKHDCADWFIVHAAKEPYHRQALGYSGRAAPRDHPEYLIARRDNRIILNLIDAADLAYVPRLIIQSALEAIAFAHAQDMPVLVHCNQGRSRAPSIAMMYLAPELEASFAAAQEQFRALYPDYAPAEGIRQFAERHWAELHARTFPVTLSGWQV